MIEAGGDRRLVAEVPRQAHNFHARVGSVQLAENRSGAIRAAVIHVDNLKIHAALPGRDEQAAIGFADNQFFIEAGNDDRQPAIALRTGWAARHGIGISRRSHLHSPLYAKHSLDYTSQLHRRWTPPWPAQEDSEV